MAGNKNFGKHIKKLREAKGYSQEKLAELIGLEYQTISRIETGYYFTSYENLQKIAQVLNLTIKDLFDFPENELPKNEVLQSIIEDIYSLEEKELKIIRKMINLYFETKKI